MTVIDISQEVFSCQVFPGDPKPEKTALLRIASGDVCNLTAFSMCAHNGTHIDAPCHFIEGDKRIDELDVSVFVGDAGVVLLEGVWLRGVDESKYLLSAVALNLGGRDGAPCRVVLIR